jgi:LL-diaminopimelate aminotransferase
MPAYPAHFRGTILAGGIPMALPVDKDFQPQFELIPQDILDKTKLIILSYPTNPTAATATRESFEKAVAFCKKHQKILVSDFAYSEIYFDKIKNISMLSIPGAKDVCIEFHTCSKSFSMAGFRIGFAVGNKKLLATLAKIKTNLDYGLFMINQRAAIAALSVPEKDLDKTRKIYQKRRDIMYKGLKKLGCKLKKPSATMYMWVPVPAGYDSAGFATKLIEETGVVVAPGTAFGAEGEGFVRLALVEDKKRLQEALARLEKANIRWA